MTDDTASANLHHALEQGSEIVHKVKSTVLIRRGGKASDMFVVLSGKVRLDLGIDSAVGRTCGQGACICRYFSFRAIATTAWSFYSSALR